MAAYFISGWFAMVSQTKTRPFKLAGKKKSQPAFARRTNHPPTMSVSDDTSLAHWMMTMTQYLYLLYQNGFGSWCCKVVNKSDNAAESRIIGQLHVANRQQKRALFGGAASAELPTSMLDASRIRPVPDNQEVFMATDDGDERSLIIEILEIPHVEGKQASDVASGCLFHVSAVADDNDASSSEVLRHSESASLRHRAVARQHIPRKGGVYIVLEVLRLPEHDADVVISAHVPDTGNVDGLVRDTERLVQQVAETFELHDSSLFAP